MGLHRNEKDILRVLFKEGRSLTLQEIANLSGMSWLTVKKYIQMMVDKFLVCELGCSKRKKYELDERLLQALEMRRHE